MDNELKTKVAILGAGCSCAYGYPLAIQMKDQLSQFAKSIEVSAPRLHKLACDTLDLFNKLAAQGFPAQTLDELAWFVHQQKIRAPAGTFPDENGYRLVEEAKVAVSAMFLAKEHDLETKALNGYRKMLRRIFGGTTRCELALRESPWRILTFNYDRLFEIAFQQHFRVDSTLAFYGGSVLNSGLYPVVPKKVEVDTSRFSFLKLHGSVGFTSVDEYGQCNHYHSLPDLLKSLPIADETFFFRDGRGNNSNRIIPSLIVFPHEKNHLKEYPRNTLPFRVYIPEIWKAARTFLSQAKEIQIIGYSVPESDGEAFGDLLRAAERCSKIVVKDPHPTKIHDNLREMLPHFKGEIETVECVFE